MSNFTDNTKAIGEFQECDYKHYFQYATAEENVFGYPHKVSVGMEFRFAKVLKTIAHVIVDEDDFGNPIIEKWNIKRHYQYE